MFPPTVTANPAAWSIFPVNAVVVDFPFVPVMAITRPFSQRYASSTSPITGTPLSQLLKRRPNVAPAELPFALKSIALEASDRAVLHQRIATRFDAMLAAGLVDEVRALRARYPDLSAAMPSMRCVGYRQVWEMQDGSLPQSELRERGIYATRQLAKRQITWLRGFGELLRIDCLRADAADQVITAARRFIEAVSPRAPS